MLLYITLKSKKCEKINTILCYKHLSLGQLSRGEERSFDFLCTVNLLNDMLSRCLGHLTIQLNLESNLINEK